MKNPKKEVSPEAMMEDLTKDYPPFLDGLETSEIQETDFQEELPKSPHPTPIRSFVDNNENVHYVQSSPRSKAEPEVGEYILMVAGEVDVTGTQADVIARAKHLLYNKDVPQKDLVVLKRIQLRVGVYLES
jgi:hypothetical protein